jgi:pimeloyl-ACP methyl ester carboxylesterase
MKKTLIVAAVLALTAPALTAPAWGATGTASPTAPAGAATQAASFLQGAAPEDKFSAGKVAVERVGDHGTPLILIPGLSSGPWAWRTTVDQFKADHVVYVLTLPGFDGLAPVSGDPIATALDGVKELIASRKLVKPVLVGHSLGATLGFDFAERNPGVLGGLVAIDGLPVMPGTENLPAEQRSQMAAGMKARMGAQSREQFAQQQRQYMRAIGSADMAKADAMAELSARSDPAAVMDYMEADLKLDLRAGLPKIAVPVLVIAPYFEADMAPRGINQDMAKQYVTGLLAGTPKLSVVQVTPARHFAMIDQPQQVNDAIRNYLQAL